MKTMPWLPRELMKYEVARIVLGLLVAEGQEVTPKDLQWLYLHKVEDLIKRTPDWLMALETFMPTTADVVSIYLDADPAPWSVVQNMAEADEWPSAITSLSLYLQGKGSIEDIKDDLGWEPYLEDEIEVSQQEFKKELEDLDLWEFLEYAT